MNEQPIESSEQQDNVSMRMDRVNDSVPPLKMVRGSRCADVRHEIGTRLREKSRGFGVPFTGRSQLRWFCVPP
jgi:hypothetical protein